MKNLLKKLSFGVVLIAATFFVANTTSVEPAEAYYGNWKSQTQTCTVTKMTSVINHLSGTTGNGMSIETTTIVTYEGTKRVCRDGGGWCFWGSSCSG